MLCRIEALREDAPPVNAQTVSVDASGFREDYLKQLEEFRGAYRDGCNNLRIDYVPLDTSMQFDKALIEYRVRFDPIFDAISFQGVPDVRIIVFFGVPVMAMVRLPTRASDGKANLHQGAVGAGIDMGTGVTLKGVLDNEIVDEHPDTGALVTGLEIPSWDFILESSARAYEVTELGYLGVDMVIDKDLGPMILEMNARPGLSIQIANGEGLTQRVARIDAIYDADASPEKRAHTARREFAAERQTSIHL